MYSGQKGRAGTVREGYIYQGHGEPHDGIDWLPAPPPWRDMRRQNGSEGPGDIRPVGARAHTYRATEETVQSVNAALMLRRPLLVTGPPGSGKSSLAYHIAHELRLGRVLQWPITSRSTLKDGLYSYDAIGRLQEAGLAASGQSSRSSRAPAAYDGSGSGSYDAPGAGRYEGRGSAPVDGSRAEQPDIGTFIRLGPLGTALLPAERPRMLLIDEIDKSDLDLPNDLLHVFENGEFVIPELARVSRATPDVQVHTDDGRAGSGGGMAAITDGWVGCTTFPVVILTSNGERDFPAAFLRRCIRLDLPSPSVQRLAEIVQAHLGDEGVRRGAHLIEDFVRRQAEGMLSTDQLLNAVYLLLGNGTGQSREELLEQVLRSLGPGD